MIKWEDKNNNWPKKQKNIGLTQDSLCIESDILFRLEIIACFLYPIFLAVFFFKKNNNWNSEIPMEKARKISLCRDLVGKR